MRDWEKIENSRLYNLLAKIDRFATGRDQSKYSLGEAIIILTGGLIISGIALIADFLGKPCAKKEDEQKNA